MATLGGVAAVGALSFGGVGAMTAEADTGPERARAGVTANLRIGPSTEVGVRAVVQPGDALAIACVAPGTEIDGDRNWYALTDQLGWISATLVEGAGTVEPCHGGIDGSTAIVGADDVNVRRGPSTADESVGPLSAGERVTVVCGAKGEVIDDAPRWFLLAGGNWVTGAYLPSVPADEVPDCDS